LYRLHFRNGVFYGENTGAILVPITNFKLPGNAAVGLEPRCGFSLFVSYSIFWNAQPRLASLAKSQPSDLHMLFLSSHSPPLSPSQLGNCQHCDGRLVRVQSYLDTRSGRTVRIFNCTGCQKLAWDN
jgi:hypothetical protein